MNLLNRLETKIGHLAIPRIIRLVCFLNIIVFIAYRLNPPFVSMLTLDPERVLAGEVWRIFTFMFIPSLGAPIADWLFTALYIWFMWWIGDGLEEALGAFRLNVFFLLGVLGCTVAAFFTGGGFSAAMVNSTLFFAFARFYPEQVIYLFFVVPVKIRWLAWFNGVLLLLGFVSNGWDYRLALIVAFTNYLLFFGRSIMADAAMRRETAGRRRKFDAATVSEEALHICKSCGRTELVAPELEFRVAADGEEYCTEHLPAK